MNQDISSYCPKMFPFLHFIMFSDILLLSGRHNSRSIRTNGENKKTTAMNIKTQKAFSKNFYIVLHKNLFMYREYIRTLNLYDI